MQAVRFFVACFTVPSLILGAQVVHNNEDKGKLIAEEVEHDP